VLTNRKERDRKVEIQLIDARQFFVKMRKSLGNKRNKIGDKDEGEPDQIGDIARIHSGYRDGETRSFTVDGQAKTLVVSKIFDNADFGYHKNHRRAAATTELPGKRRAHRAAGGRDRLQESRHQQQEERRGAPRRDRGGPDPVGRDSCSAAGDRRQ
jgi:hypothetical protein